MKRGVRYIVANLLIVTSLAIVFVPIARACDALDLYLLLYVQRKTDMGKSPELVILYDEAFHGLMKKLFTAFGRRHPEIRIRSEASSSRRALRKVVDLRREVDLVVVSDARLVTGHLIPELTGTYVQFAQDAMVLAHQRGKDKNADLTDGAWVEQLGSKGWRLAMVDPEKDACGYRTVLLWKLAQRRWAKKAGKDLNERLLALCPASLRAADVGGVLAMLDRGDADCAFVYRSVARQRKLDWVELSPEVNLGVGDHFHTHAAYPTVSVEVPGPIPSKREVVKGDRVTYCLAMVKTGPNLEASKNFMRFLVSPDGIKAMKEAGVDPIRWTNVFRESIVKYPNRQVQETEKRLQGFRGEGAPGTAGGLAPTRPVGRLNEGPFKDSRPKHRIAPAKGWSVVGEVKASEKLRQ